jgi:DNA-binding LacI/PurR family transcriptional regulator
MAARRPKSPSIYDIAREAGVSISMVSRVLNDSAPVAAEKRERIERLLVERNYVPNPAARSLARRSCNTFGVALDNTGPEYSQLFATPILAGISEWCRSAGRGLMLMWSGLDENVLDAFDASAGKVDGALLLDVSPDIEVAGRLDTDGVPCIVVNGPSPISGIPSVQVDNFMGGRLAVRHLVACGHRRIGVISGDQSLPSGGPRHDGALQALAEAGISSPTGWLVDALFSPDRAREAVQAIFAGRDRDATPTALFVGSDVMAFAVVDELRALGLSVPGDVSIIGFDDSLIAPLANPPLTTVAQPLHGMGYAAAALLDRVLAGDEVEDIVLPVSLCERQSVSCVSGVAE